MAEAIPTNQQQPLELFVEGELENAISSEEEYGEIEFEQTILDKNTDLHFSAAFGKIDSMKEDLECPDQKIDAENFMGWTPLMMSIRNGHIEAVKFLLERGADITKKNKLGMNCFNLSVANGKMELVDIVLRHMLKGGISRNKIQENLSPISLALVFRKTHLLPNLISQGFNPNSTTCKTGLTPLMFAAAVSTEKVISVLEAKGANPNARNYMGVSYKDILQWRRHGLDGMRENCSSKPKLALPPTDVRNRPSTSTSVDLEAPQMVQEVTTIPIVEKIASPIPSQNNQRAEEKKEGALELCGVSASGFVPQEVCAVTESNFNRDESSCNSEKDQRRLNRTDGHFPPVNVAKPHHVAPTRARRDKNLPQPLTIRNDSPIINHSHQFQSPYNGLPCPLYIPVMNSPFVPSPVTPMMVPPPYTYQSFMASVGDMPQNSPMHVMPPQNQYQYGPPGPPMFFPSPMTRPDPNFSYDNVNPNPNPYNNNNSPMFYAVYPNIPHVYSMPEQKP